MVRLLAQCAECYQYFDTERRKGDDGTYYFIPAHVCFVGPHQTTVKGDWHRAIGIVEELTFDLFPDPEPPSARAGFDAEPF